MPLNNPGSNRPNVTCTNYTNTKSSLTAATSGTIIAANSNRGYLLLTNNTSYDVTFTIGKTPAIINEGGILKGNGGSYEMLPGINLSDKAIYGISTAAVDISIIEGT